MMITEKFRKGRVELGVEAEGIPLIFNNVKWLQVSERGLVVIRFGDDITYVRHPGTYEGLRYFELG